MIFHNRLRILLTTEHFFQWYVVKVNLTIIIQRITHAFECAFGCAFDKSHVCGSHSNANV